MKKEIIEFDGKTFVRYPESNRPTDRKYFKAVVYLHREVWKKTYGEIPEGYDIHHIDGNHSNNSIENLECVSRIEHFKKHSERAKVSKEDDIFENSRKWHQSQEGFEFHSQLSKNSWKTRVKIKVNCEMCKKEIHRYNTSSTGVYLCCGWCQTKYRRLSGIDNVEGECSICFKKFIYNKYKPKLTCSLKCQTVQRKKTMSNEV